MLPNAISKDVPYETFWHLTPKKLEAFYKAHQIKMEEKNQLAWFFNQYTLSAVWFAVEHNIHGRKANSKYAEKPFPLYEKDKKEELTEEEKQREVDLFFAREKARRINWKRNHQKDDKVS